jgi:hypothetical protein
LWKLGDDLIIGSLGDVVVDKLIGHISHYLGANYGENCSQDGKDGHRYHFDPIGA